MCKSYRLLASLLAVTEASADMGCGHTKIRREHPSSGCLGGYFLLRGGVEGATSPALPVLQARFWCPRKQRCRWCRPLCDKPFCSDRL